MKKYVLFLMIVLAGISLFACGKGETNIVSGGEKETAASSGGEEEMNKEDISETESYVIVVSVGGREMTADIVKNSSGKAFIDLLKDGPITISMHDYGNFEKVGELPCLLPRNDERITTEPGDIIMYQGNQITIYYDVNIWNFTKLGKIRDINKAQLKSYLGTGNAEITFSIKK